MTLTGSEFVRRYLRHVLPSGLRSIRYYGFCHPAAKAKRQRIQIHTGMPFELNSRPSTVEGRKTNSSQRTNSECVLLAMGELDGASIGI